MEVLTQVASPTAASALVIIILFWLFLLSKYKFGDKKKNKSAPEAKGSWPVIGHLHLLAGPEPAHRVLGKMADKYGPIFTFKMGVHRALVVSNWEVAKECLTTNDKVFANRPKTVAMELLGYNFSLIGFSPYGSYWRQARKVATLELLSNHRLEKLKHVRESEMKTSLKELYELWSGSNKMSLSVEMKRWFGDITLNMILRLVVGKRCRESDVWKHELITFFELSGKFLVSDAMPFLRWLDIGGSEKAMKKTAKELDITVQGWLDEHKRKRTSVEFKEDEDFMDVMLSILQDDDAFHGHDADTVNKAMCLTMILAASDTTTVTLTWALTLLLNHREILEKVRNELDHHVGRERLVQESDVKNLVYLQAVLKETMRLYPGIPLLIPHESIEDCVVSGYHIPAQTRLFFNAWKIHVDPTIWSDPFTFKPERFVTDHKDFDVRGQNFEYMPFSSGRRMCPGVSFALQVMHLTLASLLHGFDVETESNNPVDTSESVALTYVKASPLEVFLAPRLASHHYV